MALQKEAFHQASPSEAFLMNCWYVAAWDHELIDAKPLARTILGKPLVLDGPFAETKEQLAGYYILDCKDLDEAIAWAARIPTACKGGEGCVEIRPIMGLPSR